MDLFVVNRYFGDEETENKDVNEKEKLSLLLSKIEKRRKRKEEISKSHSDTSNIVGNEKRKQKSVESGDESDIHEKSNQGETVNSAQKKRHKRKRNRRLNATGEEVDEEEGDNEGKNVESKSGEKVEGYTVLGSDKFQKKLKVKRVLPHWLTSPADLQPPSSLAVADVAGLHPDMVRALQLTGISHFFPVQAQVIPWLLFTHSKPQQYWPHDVCVSAPTGSGKTLTFVVPIVQVLCSRLVVQVRALVVLPVQDLATQVHRVFLSCSAHTNLRVALLTGQTAFHKEQQQLVASSGVSGHRSLVDIVVTTPGRLVDHLHNTPGFTLQHLRFLVIDEADRVLENVQNDWLYHLNSYIHQAGSQAPPLTVSLLESAPAPRPQKLLLSATLTQDPEKLQQLGLFQPKLFTSLVRQEDEARKFSMPAELTEYVCVVGAEVKPLALYHVVASHGWQRVLVFVGSREEARRLALLLTHLGHGSLSVAELSSRLPRLTRDKLLRRFGSGNINVLVSSDALARGMDIPGVDYVVLYSMPKSIKNYIHRVGRTARAGRPGTAVTMVLEDQVAQLNNMLRAAGKASLEQLQIQEAELEALSERYSSALEALKESLSQQQRS